MSDTCDTADYKKLTTGECHYCDYWERKKCVGRKCKWYKRLVKKHRRKKHDQTKRSDR